MSELTSWGELDAQFGDAIGVIDKAIGAHLAQYERGIARDEFYHASEGLTYSVIMALRGAGYAVSRAS